MGFAFDVDANVGLAFFWVFARADLGISIAMIGSSAGNGNALVGFTSALAIGATRNHRVEAVVVRRAVNWHASVVVASFLNTTVSISSAFLDLAFVGFAETVSIFTAIDVVVLAHLVASAFDLLTSERLSVAKLINVAVRVVSAVFFDASVLVASVGIVVF